MNSDSMLRIHLESHAAPLELACCGGDAEMVAFQIGSMGFRELDRAQSATVSGSVAGSVALDPLLEQIAMRFFGRLPSQEDKAFSECLGQGDQARAGFIRKVVSVDDSVEPASSKQWGSSPTGQAASSMLCLPGWSISPRSPHWGQAFEASPSLDGSIPVAIDLSCAPCGLAIRAPQSQALGLARAAGRLNELCWPLMPFDLTLDGAGAEIGFDPSVSMAAKAALRLAGSRWFPAWVASGAPHIKEMSRAAGCSIQAMLARLWMDADGALERKAGSPIVEVSHWRHASCLQGGRRFEDGLSLAFNAGLRFLGRSNDAVRAMGESTLMGHAKMGMATQIAGALERVIQVDHDKGAFAERMRESLARIQAVALADGLLPAPAHAKKSSSL